MAGLIAEPVRDHPSYASGGRALSKTVDGSACAAYTRHEFENRFQIHQPRRSNHFMADPEPQGWPPSPHDPRERVEIASLDGWQVRSFRAGGVKQRYFAPRGMLHLQLWHPAAGISLLTPSRITGQRYEVYPIRGWKFAHHELRAIAGAIRSEHGVQLPSRAAIVALERWYVSRLRRVPATSVDITVGEQNR